MLSVFHLQFQVWTIFLSFRIGSSSTLQLFFHPSARRNAPLSCARRGVGNVGSMGRNGPSSVNASFEGSRLHWPRAAAFELLSDLLFRRARCPEAIAGSGNLAAHAILDVPSSVERDTSPQRNTKGLVAAPRFGIAPDRRATSSCRLDRRVPSRGIRARRRAARRMRTAVSCCAHSVALYTARALCTRRLRIARVCN